MFDSAELSRAGGRAENQDAVGSSRVGRCHCWVLADGLGGHRGGAVAARLAVETAIAAFEADAEVSAAVVQRYVEAANTAVVAGQQADPALSRMRATLVLLVADRRHVVWGHVGDARLYRLEAGRLSHRTRDHSVSQALVDAGEISPSRHADHEDRDRILRAVGDAKGVSPTLLDASEPLRRGDAFLLCSDGFWEAVSDTAVEIGYAATPSSSAWLRRLEHRVIGRLTEESDNYSAIAVRVDDAVDHLPPPRVYDEITARGPRVSAPASARPDSTPPATRSRWRPSALLLLVAVGAGVGGWVWRGSTSRGSPTVPEPVVTSPVEVESPASPRDLDPGVVYVVEDDRYFESLDEAIDLAIPGTEVWLGRGRHTPEVREMAHEIHLRGAGIDETTIDLSDGPGFVVRSDRGSLIDLELCCAAEGAVLSLAGSFEGLVASVRLTGGAGVGLAVEEMAHPTVEGAEVRGNAGVRIVVGESADPMFIDMPDEQTERLGRDEP